jgi:acetyl-CoA C-acetyltransferase
MSDNDIFIVAGKRSAYGRYLGSLSDVDPVELASTVARAALQQARQEAKGDFPIDHVFMGNCIPTTFASPSTTGRQVSLALGLKGFAVTIDTACCSPLTGLRLATWGMSVGGIAAVLAVGVEMMSKVPHLLRNLRGGVKAGAAELIDPIFPIEYKGYTPVSVDASNGAEKHGVPRTMLDAWALGSQQKWARAMKKGLFREEIVPVSVKVKKGEFVFDTDEFPRPDSTYSRLQTLPPVFGSKTTTAGNAPGLNDGASAAVAATGRTVREHGLKPLARIIATAGVAGEPEGISWVPAMAIREALAKANLTVEQLDVIEINEAFAAMPLVSTKILAGGDEEKWLELLRKTNPNGGAIAIGHPVGASGLRILLTMVYELRRRGGGRGACAICGGLSQGEAVVLEV